MIRHIAFTLTFIAVLAAAAPAVARSTGACGTYGAVWEANIDRQMAEVLDTSAPGIRAEALHLVLVLANKGCLTSAHRRVARRLLSIYQWDRDEAHRMMALAGLHATGNPYAMERLQEVVGEVRSDRLRRVTQAALADYQGEPVASGR